MKTQEVTFEVIDLSEVKGGFASIASEGGCGGSNGNCGNTSGCGGSNGNCGGGSGCGGDNGNCNKLSKGIGGTNELCIPIEI